MMEKGERDRLLADLCREETRGLRGRRLELVGAAADLTLVYRFGKTGDLTHPEEQYKVALERLGVTGEVEYDPEHALALAKLARELAFDEEHRIGELEMLGTTYRVTGMLERELALRDREEGGRVYQRAA